MCLLFFPEVFFFLLLGKNIVCLCKEALFTRPDIIKTFQTSVCVKEIFPRKKKSVKKQSGWKINAEFWAVGVKNRVCSKDMHGNFFQCFYFFLVKKIPNHVHRTFVEYFLSKKKKKVEKIFHSSTMNIHGFFFQVFFFFLQKKKHPCPKTCLVFLSMFIGHARFPSMFIGHARFPSMFIGHAWELLLL